MASINIPEIKGNKGIPEQKRDIEPINDISVNKRKPSVGRKLSNTFIKEDVSTVKNHLFFDVIVPTLKEMVISGIEMMFYGGTTPRDRHYRRGTNERTSYQKIYTSDGRRIDDDRRSTRVSRQSNMCEDLEFNSRASAEDVLYSIRSYYNQYGNVSLSDVYTIINKTEWIQSTDNNWGWEDISGIRIEEFRDKYYMTFPRLIPLR